MTSAFPLLQQKQCVNWGQSLFRRALLPPAPSTQAKLNAAQALGDCGVPVSADACSCGEYSCTVVLGPTNAREDEPALISFLEFIH